MRIIVYARKKRGDYLHVYTHNCTNMPIVEQLNLENSPKFWVALHVLLAGIYVKSFQCRKTKKIWVDGISKFELRYHYDGHQGYYGPKCIFLFLSDFL